MSVRLTFLAPFLLLLPSLAYAQVGASITLSSDERFRGRSISRGDPALTVNVSYDHPSGIYASAAATAAIVEADPKIINVQANIGYVHRTAAGPSLEAGVVRSNYSEYYSGGRATHYTDFYAGVLTRRLAFHLHYSPDYFQPGMQTLYAEIDGVAEPAPDWHLTGHVGALVRLAGPAPPRAHDVDYDWRIGAARSMGPFELQFGLSGGGPGSEYYEGRRHDRTVATVSLVWSL